MYCEGRSGYKRVLIIRFQQLVIGKKSILFHFIYFIIAPIYLGLKQNFRILNREKTKKEFTVIISNQNFNNENRMLIFKHIEKIKRPIL